MESDHQFTQIVNVDLDQDQMFLVLELKWISVDVAFDEAFHLIIGFFQRFHRG